ncbi:winged helix-turn-helix domain-containing protein [Streptosporangium algeriense]|uniref:Winged helix-turn-helix domain-containing protein n=1 Tax=Streptosporangium algeriense TaxID=1682748 RepID=A0ABW3DM22_9ACTN
MARAAEVYERHVLWKRGGENALIPKGAAGAGCELTGKQPDRLQTPLDQGAAAHGWTDQCWTAVRVTLLITEKFHVRYTACGVAYPLKRPGWSFQLPAHRAGRFKCPHTGRSAVTGPRGHQGEAGVADDKSTSATTWGSWLVFADEPGQGLRLSLAKGLRPPKGRT